jgi:predicted nucleotidyltransferase
MKPFKPVRTHDTDLTLDTLVWIPEDLKKSLSEVVSFLKKSFLSEVASIGLYGSWQRGEVSPESDVDIVVCLNQDVNWFDAEHGVVNRSAASKDQRRWHGIEKKLNARRLYPRVFSIAVVTPGMLVYYSAHGPIHLQNWVYALRNCFPLWAARSIDGERDKHEV